MTGSHRATSQTSRTAIGYGIFSGIIGIIVLIVLTQINWNSSSKMASAPSSHISASVPTPIPTVSVPTVTAPPTVKAPETTTAPQKPTLVYVVKPGDNLTVIAEWFHSRGYMDIYAWNKQLIGSDPNLIHVGQHLIVSPGSAQQKIVNTP